MAEQWPTLTFYQRFESAIALALTLIITIIILVALFHLTVEVIGGLVLGRVNPLEYSLQTVFRRVYVADRLEFTTAALRVPASRASNQGGRFIACSPGPVLILAFRYDLRSCWIGGGHLALGITYWCCESVRTVPAGAQATPPVNRDSTAQDPRADPRARHARW